MKFLFKAQSLSHCFYVYYAAKVFYDGSKLKAPKPDTKTSKNQQVGKTGNVNPQPRQRCCKKIHLRKETRVQTP